MQEAEDVKAYYYFDEAGDPQILARKGVNLVERGVSSKVFMAGYLETKNPSEISKALVQLREEISKDEYLTGIPSIKKTKRMFHANVDSGIDCYFSAMGSTVRQDNMEAAIQNAVVVFQNKWQKKNVSNIRVFIQQSSEIPLLQAADYVLWTIQRVYERHDFRYYNYLKDKIKLVHDIFDFDKYPRTYYTPVFPLEAEKIDPV
ncbi:MAG: DUF3800 domain-containing protein [Treponema sp.]